MRKTQNRLLIFFHKLDIIFAAKETLYTGNVLYGVSSAVALLAFKFNRKQNISGQIICVSK
jgi:hypothetical protein